MNRFLQEIHEQPAVLRRIASAYGTSLGNVLHDAAAYLRRVPVRRYAGMGSSQYVAAPAVANLNRAGLPTMLYDAAELYHYELSPHDPGRAESSGLGGFCLSSHSGESVEIRLLLEALGGAPVVGLTDHPDSTLGRASRYVLPILAGEQAAVGTKTNTALIAVHLLLAARILGEPLPLDVLEQAAKVLEGILAAWARGRLQEAVGFLGDPPFISLLGRGPGLACAHLAAITVEEAAQIPCEAMSAALFRHGPMEIASDRYRFVLFSPSGKTERLMWKLATDLARFGAPVLVLSDNGHPETGGAAQDGAGSPVGAEERREAIRLVDVPVPGGAAGRIMAICVRPVSAGEGWRILPLLVVSQLLAYELARHRGVEPGLLRKAAAVTLEE